MAMFIGLFEIFVAFIFFLVFYCFLLHRKTQKPLLTNWPVLRMLPGLTPQLPRIYNWTAEVLEATGMTFCFKGPWLSGTDILLTVDPVNVQYILSSNFSNYPKGEEFKKIFEIMGDAIFNVDSGLWEDMRNLSLSVFSHPKYQEFSVTTTVSKLKQGLIPILDKAVEEHCVVDLQDLFQRLLYDTSSILMTGYDPRCLSFEMPEVEFGDAVNGVADGVFYRHVKPIFIWKLQYWIGLGVEKKLRRGVAVVDRMLANVISTKRAELESQGGHKREAMDMLTHFMTADTTKYKHLKPSSDKFMRDVIFGFLAAGRDTISSALTWFFLLLSKNPEAMAKIRQEINKMTKFDFEDLDKLVYLDAAVRETLRLYPSVPFNHKSPAKPDVLPSGHRVDKNWKILIPIFALGRMTSVWGDDANDFRPERWILASGRLKHEPSYKFLAFNAGPRTCLGKKLTFLQMKTVAVEIIRNYDIKVVEEPKTEPVPSVLLRMQHGLKVSVTRVLQAIEDCLDLTPQPSFILQEALPNILEKTPMEFFVKKLNAMRHNVELSCERLKEIPCLFCPKKPESCSYLWVKLDTSMLDNIKNDFDFCTKLVSEESLVLIPGVALGAENWVRISIGTDESVLEEIFDRLKSFYDRHAISKETITSNGDTINQRIASVILV